MRDYLQDSNCSAIFFAKSDELKFDLLEFLKKENFKCEEFVQSPTLISLHAHPQNTLTKWDLLLGKSSDTHWVLENLDENQTLVSWKRKINPWVRVLFCSLSFILSILFLASCSWVEHLSLPIHFGWEKWFDVLKTNRPKDGAVFYLSLYILFNLFFMWVSVKNSIKLWSKFLFSQHKLSIANQSIIKEHGAKEFYFHWAFAWFIFITVSLVLYMKPMALWIFYFLIPLGLLVPVGFFGDGRSKFRLSQLEGLLIVNFGLLGIAVIPLIFIWQSKNFSIFEAQLLVDAFSVSPRSPLTDGVITEFNSLFRQHLPMFIGYLIIIGSFFVFGLFNPFYRSDEGRKHLQAQYKEAVLHLKQINEFRNKYIDSFLKAGSVLLAFNFFAAWIIIVYQFIGNLTRVFGGILMPGIYFFDDRHIVLLSFMATLGNYASGEMLGKVIAVIFVLPAITVIILSVFFILAGCFSMPRSIEPNSMPTELNRKWIVLNKIVSQLYGVGNLHIELSLVENNQINGFAQTLPFSKNSKIIITSEALKVLSIDELECLLAHEVGHIKSPGYFLVCSILLTSRYLLGSVSFLTALFDIPKAELRADSIAVRELTRIHGKNGEKTYIDFLRKYSDANPAISNNPLVRRRISSFLGALRSNENDLKNKETISLIDLIGIRMKNNFLMFVKIAFLNEGIQNSHPSFETRVKSIRSGVIL